MSGPLLGTGAAQAQDLGGRGGSLTGLVVDAESGDPLIGATGALWNFVEEETTLVKGTVTDSSGAVEAAEGATLVAVTERVECRPVGDDSTAHA